MKDHKEVVGKVIDYRVFTEQTGVTIYKHLQNRRLTVDSLRYLELF